MIDNAEDRFKFSAMIDEIGCQQPAWKELMTTESALVSSARCLHSRSDLILELRKASRLSSIGSTIVCSFGSSYECGLRR